MTKKGNASKTLELIKKNVTIKDKAILIFAIFICSMIWWLNPKNQNYFPEPKTILKANIPRATFCSIFLYLREDMTFKVIVTDMAGQTEKFEGNYEIISDNIHFKNQAYTDDYIPRIIYRNKNWLFFTPTQNLNDTASCRECFKILEEDK